MTLAPCLEDLLKLDDTQYHDKFGDTYPIIRHKGPRLLSYPNLFFSESFIKNILDVFLKHNTDISHSKDIEDMAAYIYFCEEKLSRYKLHNLCYLTIATMIALEHIDFPVYIRSRTFGMECISPKAYGGLGEDIFQLTYKPAYTRIDKLSIKEKKYIECVLREYGELSDEALNESVIKQDCVWTPERKIVSHDLIYQMYKMRFDLAMETYDLHL